MSTGAALLAALDVASLAAEAPIAPGSAEEQRHAAGFAAALGLNELLIAHGCIWDEVMDAPDTRLAKFCGLLGSRNEAERKTAYDHSVRLLQRQNMRWSELVRLPPALAEARVPVALPASVLPPERDWPATVAGLLARAAWRSSPEHDLLLAAAARVAEGRAIGDEEARQLRDMWWAAELNSCSPEEATP